MINWLLNGLEKLASHFKRMTLVVPLIQNLDLPKESNVREIPISELELSTKLDVGGFSEVFKGTWNSQPVAIKKVLKRRQEDKEAEIMWEMNHPNILKLHGIYYAKDSPHPNLVIEYVETGSLYDILTKSKTNEHIKNYRVKISQEIASGLDYLEKNKIIHRDMKPENILISKTWGAIISDYGMAVKFTDSSYASDRCVGNIYYMAPEVLVKNTAGKYEYTPKVDHYGLGGIIYTLWHYKSPYSHKNEKDVVMLKKQGKHDDIPATTPEHIKSLVLNLWSFDPKSRPNPADVIERLNPLTEPSHKPELRLS